MKILVTGAGGFIGPHLCRRLIQRGDSLRVLLRNPARDSARAPAGIDDVVYFDDIGKEQDFDTLLANIDGVVHLAARAHVLNEQHSNPLEEFRRVNVHGTEQLARSAVRIGVKRFLFVSSIGVNGEISPRAGFTEANAPNPQKPYAISKWEAEERLREIISPSAMEYTIVRPPLVYGHGAPGNFAMLRNLVLKRMPLPFGGSTNMRTLIGVENLVDFLAHAIVAPQAANELFLIGDLQPLSLAELVKAMGVASGRTVLLLPASAPIVERIAVTLGKKDIARSLFGTLVVDSSKARRVLEWNQPFSLAEGLARAMR